MSYYKKTTTEIERGVAYHTLPQLKETQSMEKEKSTMRTLNARLEEQLNELKQKKAENDRLEKDIENYKKLLKMPGRDVYSSQLGVDLYNARKGLNTLSNQNSVNKSRLARSLLELDSLRERINEEVEFQEKGRMKIKSLQLQIAQSSEEIQRLKHDFITNQNSLLLIIQKNWKLLQDYEKLSDNLDKAFETNVFFQIDIHSLNERKKFENELFKVMKNELQRMTLCDNSGKKYIDFEGFYQSELKNVKTKIREDFMNMNEEGYELLQSEYNERYSKIVEEIEYKESTKAATQNLNDETTLTGLKTQFSQNEAELFELKDRQNNLQRKLEELTAKKGLTQVTVSKDIEAKDREITHLHNQINQLKSDAWELLTLSHKINSEISLYDTLLGTRFEKYFNQMRVHNEISTDFLFEKYKKLEFISFDDTVNTSDKPARKHYEEEIRYQGQFIKKQKDDFSYKHKFNFERIILIDEELEELRKYQDELDRKRKGNFKKFH